MGACRGSPWHRSNAVTCTGGRAVSLHGCRPSLPPFFFLSYTSTCVRRIARAQRPTHDGFCWKRNSLTIRKGGKSENESRNDQMLGEYGEEKMEVVLAVESKIEKKKKRGGGGVRNVSIMPRRAKGKNNHFLRQLLFSLFILIFYCGCFLPSRIRCCCCGY